MSLFIRSCINSGPTTVSQRRALSTAPPSHFPTPARRAYKPERAISRPLKNGIEDIIEDDAPFERSGRPAWAIQKEALKQKLGGEAWNPRKKLSPDTMEGIRHLNSSQPEKFTTPVLAQHFKVTPEAIRRMLKSKWRPSDEEYDARMERWNRRGERIWTNLVEMGVKPPKQWREMGVGRATNGERPKWKSRHRNLPPVRDSAGDNFVIEEGGIIPVVGESGMSKRPVDLPLSQRL